MYAAGFHFGHDASGTLIGPDGLTRFLDKERRSRVKHAMSLAAADLAEVLGGVEDEVGLIGCSSTQNVPVFHGGGFEVRFADGQAWPAKDFFSRTTDHHYRKFVTWMDDLDSRDGWVTPEGKFPYQSRLNEGFNQSYQALGLTAGQFPAVAEAMHKDGELVLHGRAFKARFYQHHYLHAYYAAYAASGTRPSLVITCDGGIGPSYFGGGIYFWTPGRKLQPVTPIDGWLGWFYDHVSVVAGFDVNGGAGKLMGLGPYGRPIYFDEALVGTRHQVTAGYTLGIEQVVDRWLARMGLDRANLPSWDPFTDRPPNVIADIAASAQLILERNIQELAGAAVRLARRAGFAFETITLSGGVALNCPANSNLAVTLGAPVLVPPAVNDEGLSIGAAVAAYFDAEGAHPAPPANYADAVYIGSDVEAPDVVSAAAAQGWSRRAGAPLAEACRLLGEGQLVGLCIGRAEVGPRALGHRSILGDPTSTETWATANRLKRREPWRPFAPAVLLERSADYFERGPDESRYMLFNYRCSTKLLPAITHYDHSARVQHVSPETGLLYQLLRELEALGRPPVVLNTSFNGPGVPIVETAADAFSEAARLGLNHILTDFGLYSAPGT